MLSLHRAVPGGRRTWLVGLLALILLAVVVVVFFFQGGGSSGLGGTSVAGAAERTAAEPGGSIETEITYAVSGGPKPVTSTGEGIFDSASGRAQIELSVPGGDGSPLKVDSVGDETMSFVRSRILSEELPAGKEWLGMEPLLGNDPTTALNAGGGAKGSLEMLRAVGGDVERIGEESVRGEETTQYKGTIDLSQAAKKFAAEGDAGMARLLKRTAVRLSGPMPVEVWVGVGGLIRRERLIERMPTDGHILELHLSIEFFDFAPHPDIALPPPAQVFDYTPVLRAELGMLDGTSLGSLEPAAGSAPLSVPAFRRQVTGICRALLTKGAHMAGRGKQLQAELSALGRAGPTASELKPVFLALGDWFEGSVYRSSSEEIAELAALAPPAKYEPDYRRYLTIYAQQAEFELAEARAFQLGRPQALDNAKHQAEVAPRKKELARILPRLGIQECGREIGSSPVSGQA